MGYYSRFFGEIKFNPPLTHAEVQDRLVLPNFSVLEIEVRETKKDTDEGVLISQTSDRIQVSYDDQAKAYTIVDDLRLLVNSIQKSRPRTYSGEILIEGEESGDIWRLRVGMQGIIIEEHAILQWPDGSKVK